MTFLTDLDDLIRHHHGDVKKLREIRDTIRHDNFITSEDKNYVETLIDEHLKNQPLEKQSSRKQPNARIKLQTKSKASDSDLQSKLTFNFSSNKRTGIFVGAAAAVAIIVIVGFTTINQDITMSSSNNPLLITLDQTQYKRADIISISGDSTSDRESIMLSIENVNGVKIWKENIQPKNGGGFSTLIIAGGGGWENNGVYTLKAVQNNSIEEIKFQIVT